MHRMSVDLTEYTLDLDKFLTLPKCVERWDSINEKNQVEKCLLSAFIESLGLKTQGAQFFVDGNVYWIDDEVNKAARKLKVTHLEGFSHICRSIFDAYAIQASVDLIWELIEKWPRVTNVKQTASASQEIFDSIRPPEDYAYKRGMANA